MLSRTMGIVKYLKDPFLRSFVLNNGRTGGGQMTCKSHYYNTSFIFKLLSADFCYKPQLHCRVSHLYRNKWDAKDNQTKQPSIWSKSNQTSCNGLHDGQIGYFLMKDSSKNIHTIVHNSIMVCCTPSYKFPGYRFQKTT